MAMSALSLHSQSYKDANKVAGVFVLWAQVCSCPRGPRAQTGSWLNRCSAQMDPSPKLLPRPKFAWAHALSNPSVVGFSVGVAQVI